MNVKKVVLSGFAGSLAGGAVVAVLFQNPLTQRVLFDPAIQSPKLLDAWSNAFLPRPVFAVIYVLLAAVYGLLYHYSNKSLPLEGWKKGAYFGILFIFLGHWIFHEYATPLNLFGEPLHLLGLELVFLASGSMVQGIVIQKVYDSDLLS